MDFPTVTFSASECDSSVASAAKAAEAIRLFCTLGAVRLGNVFSPTFRVRLHDHQLQRRALEM